VIISWTSPTPAYQDQGPQNEPLLRMVFCQYGIGGVAFLSIMVIAFIMLSLARLSAGCGVKRLVPHARGTLWYLGQNLECDKFGGEK